MIQYVDQSIFEQPVESLVNAVNCAGVMGSGVALEFKKRYPAMYEDYVERCRKKSIKAGQPYLFRDEAVIIINFPTKAHWRFPSRLQWIEAGLDRLRGLCEEEGIRSVALPRLGCGRGKLAWQDVRALIEAKLGTAPFVVIVCLGAGNEGEKP